MPEAAHSHQTVRFGVFELDLRAGELRKRGLKVRLQEKPLQVLAILLEKPGEVVTREEIRQRLWGPDTFVDFDHSLGTAINKLREALGDSAESPRFIETLPRHGYRFIGQVEPVRAVRTPRTTAALHAASAEPGLSVVPNRPAADATPAGQPSTTVQARRGRRRWLAVVATAAVAAILVFGTLFALNVAGLRDRVLSSVAASHGVPLPKIESIAVLPLENISGDPEQQYFADGMTEDLITELGKIKAMRVISRQSVMRYKGSKKPLPEIARELHVDAVLEAAVRRSGDQVRITVQLVRMNPERQVWTASYNRNLRDVLVLQSDVALAIANHVRAELTPQERAQMAARHAVNPQAYTAYLMGWTENLKSNEQGIRKSVEYWKQAIALQPDYAQAYSALAGAYNDLGMGEFLSPQEAYPEAKEAVLRALEIDDTLPRAHRRLALIKFQYDWDWPGAEAEFRRAIELGPNFADCHSIFSWLLALMGRFDEALAEMRRAQELDPFNPFYQPGDVFYLSHQFDRAIEQLQRPLRAFPTHRASGWAHCLLGRVYLAKRMFEPAIAEQKKAIMIYGESPLYLGMLGNMYGAAGKRAEALKILNQLKELSKRKYILPYDIALVYVGLGEKDEAFAWLEKAYNARSVDMKNLKVDPMFDSVRSDPRFQALLRRMNFPP